MAEGGRVHAAVGTSPGRTQRPTHRREPSLPASRGTAGGARHCRSTGWRRGRGLSGHCWPPSGEAEKNETLNGMEGELHWVQQVLGICEGGAVGTAGPPQDTRQVSTGRVARGSCEVCWDRKRAGAKPAQKPQWTLAPWPHNQIKGL